VNPTEHANAFQAYGIRGTPGFVVTDAGGTALVDDDKMSGVVRGGGPPQQVATEMLGYAAQRAAGGQVVTDPATLAALQDILSASGAGDKAKELLESALKSPDASDEQLRGLRLLKALEARLGGDPAAGLKLLGEAYPELTCAEPAAPVPDLVAPFTVKAGDKTLGTLSSALDIATAARVLSFAAAHGKDTVSAASVPADDLVGCLAYAVAFGDSALATACLDKIGDGHDLKASDLAHAGFLRGWMLASAGKDSLKDATDQLATVARSYPGEPFAPDALVILAKAAEKAGDTKTAGDAKSLAKQIYGDRLPKRLK